MNKRGQASIGRVISLILVILVVGISLIFIASDSFSGFFDLIPDLTPLESEGIEEYSEVSCGYNVGVLEEKGAFGSNDYKINILDSSGNLVDDRIEIDGNVFEGEIEIYRTLKDVDFGTVENYHLHFLDDLFYTSSELYLDVRDEIPSREYLEILNGAKIVSAENQFFVCKDRIDFVPKEDIVIYGTVVQEGNFLKFVFTKEPYLNKEFVIEFFRGDFIHGVMFSEISEYNYQTEIFGRISFGKIEFSNCALSGDISLCSVIQGLYIVEDKDGGVYYFGKLNKN